jgi:tetratricopeptide (TPR) repeat protein
MGSAVRPTTAHEAIHDQIAAVTDQIRQEPRNPLLYLKRGGLHTSHGDWEAALGDYDRAAKLDPSLTAVDLGRGRALLTAGQFHSAKDALTRFLARQPNHAEALVLRARALVHLGALDASAADYTRAIASSARLDRPNPDYYLERARVVAARGPQHVEEALHGLDEGMAQLGPLVSLQLYAIELELSTDRTQAALARLAALATHSTTPEAWLVRRGELLEQAGRVEEARLAYAEALAAVASRSARHRNTRAARELEVRLRSALARLAGKANTEESR